MELLKTVDGVKKSITIDAIDDWDWVPGRNVIAYTAHLDEPATSNIIPRISFMSIPSRRVIGTQNFKGCLSLKMTMHP